MVTRGIERITGTKRVSVGNDEFLIDRNEMYSSLNYITIHPFVLGLGVGHRRDREVSVPLSLLEDPFLEE